MENNRKTRKKGNYLDFLELFWREKDKIYWDQRYSHNLRITRELINNPLKFEDSLYEFRKIFRNRQFESYYIIIEDTGFKIKSFPEIDYIIYMVSKFYENI